MGTSQRRTDPVETATQALQALLPNLYPPEDDDEPLLRELLAEAHARIRSLEAALDRVKQAV
jgi:hypothetical protein